QNIAGPALAANYSATNNEIRPSLGRNLAACRGAAVCNATATAPLIAPQTQFEGRRTQVDIRVSRNFKLGGTSRLVAKVDVYNVLNDSSVLLVNTTYGSAFLRPVGSPNTGGAILAGRLVEFGGQLTF